VGIGRFITEDPIFGDLTDPQSLNKFPYCRNNPQKYIDPDGKVWLFFAGVGFMFTIGIIEGTMYIIEHPGDWKGALNRGLIAFDTAGVEMVITATAMVSGPLVGGAAVIAGIGMSETFLMQQGYLTGAAGIDSYETYPFGEFLYDVAMAPIEVHVETYIMEKFPGKPRSFSKEQWSAFKFYFGEIISEVTHELGHTIGKNTKRIENGPDVFQRE
jgi:hypothetical protein